MTRFFSYTRLAPTSAMPAPAATVTVYDVGTLDLATIYDDDTGTPKSNPFTADASGYFYFYAPDGRYDVRMSGGGIASPFTWGDVFVGGDLGMYPIVSESNLTAALSTIGGNNATLLISTNVAISASVTIPVNVSCWFISPGMFTVAANQVVTFAGAVVADRHQIFAGSGTVDLTDAKLDWVYPEWWGAVALKAAAGTPADSTTALVAAVESRRNILLDQGIYGTTAELFLQTDGQILRGQGIAVLSLDGQGGTTIRRLSGTDYIVRGGSWVGTECSNMVLDGNTLGGSIMRWQSISSLVENIRFMGQGGTDYALYLLATNLSTFRRLSFADGNYGHIKTDATQSALYGKFYDISMGTTNGGLGIDISNSAGLNFYGLYADAPIKVSGVCESIHFTDTLLEIGDVTGEPVISLIGLDVLNTVFRGLRIIRTSANNNDPEILIENTKNTIITDVYYRDSASVAGKAFISLDGLFYGQLTNIEIYSKNGCKAVISANTTGNRNQGLLCNNLASHSGAACTLEWYVNHLSISNCNMAQSFTIGTSEQAVFFNCSGTITRTNLEYATLFNSGDPSIGVFGDGDTTPSVAGNNTFVTANTAPTTITDFDGGDPATGPQILVRFGDSNTTLDLSANANMVGNNGVDFTGTTGDWCVATHYNGRWLVQVYKA